MDKFTVLRTQTNFINGRESEQLASYVDSTVCSAIQDLTVEEVFYDFTTPDGRYAAVLWCPEDDDNDFVELHEDTTLMDQLQWDAHEELLEDLEYMSHGHKRFKWMISLSLQQLYWIALK